MNRRLLDHLDACMAALDRSLPEDEAAAIYESLRAPVRHPQGRLSLPPPNAGLIPGGQPEPCGLVAATFQGVRRLK